MCIFLSLCACAYMHMRTRERVSVRMCVLACVFACACDVHVRVRVRVRVRARVRMHVCRYQRASLSTSVFVDWVIRGRGKLQCVPFITLKRCTTSKMPRRRK
jgi:hypothetical protein